MGGRGAGELTTDEPDGVGSEDQLGIPEPLRQRLEAMFGGSPRELAERIAEATGTSPNQVSMTLGYMFSGPHPPPEMLEAYERILPGLANRIVCQGESQTTHRQQLERDLLQLERDDRREVRAQSRLGLWLGFCVVVLGMAASIILTAMGHPLAGGLAFLGDLALLAGVFVYGSQLRREQAGPGADESR